MTISSVRQARWAVGLCAAVLILGCAMSGRTSAVRQVFPTVQTTRDLALAGDPSGVTAYAARDGAATVGYGVDLQVRSRSGPFRIRVLIDKDLVVRRVRVLEYIGARGGDVQSPRFLRRLEGKSLSDPIRIGKDVDVMTGATLSSKAVARGVRRSLRLLKEHAASAN